MSAGTTVPTSRPNERRTVNILYIILIVLLVLVVLGYFGRGRF